MNKLVYGLVVYTIMFGSSYNGSTTAPVILAGAVVKAQASPITTKFKRKDCPVCKGTGWYMSGDGIKKVDCGYCEPEKGVSVPQKTVKSIVVIPKQCDGPNCKVRTY
jgi:hypothetical protein